MLDSVIYMTLFLVQQTLRRAGAGPVELSTTIATYSAVYALACPLSGALVGSRRRPMLLIGLLLVLGDIALLTRAEDLATFQKLIGALAIGTSLVWPSFQALIAEESPGPMRPVRMAIFNLGWTAGKAGGLFCAGWVLTLAGGAGPAFRLVAGLAVLLPLLFLARFLTEPAGSVSAAAGSEGASETEGGGPESGVEDRPAAPATAPFVLALAANFLVWGVQAAVLAQIPLIGEAAGLGPGGSGMLIGGLVLAQAVTFLALRSRAERLDRPGVAAAAPALSAITLALIGLDPPAVLLALLFLVLGMAIGLSYALSLHRAMEARGVGLRTAWHEANLGLAGLSISALAGSLVEELGLVMTWRVMAAGCGIAALAIFASAGFLHRLHASPRNTSSRA